MYVQNIAAVFQLWPLILIVVAAALVFRFHRSRVTRRRRRRRLERRRYNEALQNAWMLVMRRPRHPRLTDQRDEPE